MSRVNRKEHFNTDYSAGDQVDAAEPNTLEEILTVDPMQWVMAIACLLVAMASVLPGNTFGSDNLIADALNNDIVRWLLVFVFVLQTAGKKNLLFSGVVTVVGWVVCKFLCNGGL